MNKKWSKSEGKRGKKSMHTGIRAVIHALLRVQCLQKPLVRLICAHPREHPPNKKLLRSVCATHPLAHCAERDAWLICHLEASECGAGTLRGGASTAVTPCRGGVRSEGLSVRQVREGNRILRLELELELAILDDENDHDSFQNCT